MAQWDDSENPNDPYGGSQPQNWWEGPPPPGYSGQWPPALPPGASYGPNLGQIIYPTTPNGTPTTSGKPDDLYHPGDFGNTPPPPTTTNTPPPTNTTKAPPTTAPIDPGVIGHPTPNADPTAPTFDPPTYTPPPAYVAPPAFSYGDFVAPDPNDLQNDPWTKYTLKNEQDSIQRGAAAKGILNTGGTINDLLVNAADVNSQGYQGLWQRKMDEYSTNRGNAYENYKTNYGISKDVYDDNYQTQYTDPFKFGYQGAMDSFNANIHNYDQSQYYATHAADQNRQYDWAQTLFGYQQQQDEWARKFKLLGLI